MSLVLVLGASGFLGRWVTAALRATPGLEVVGWGRGGRSAAGGAPTDLDLATSEVVAIARAIDAVGPAVIVDCVGRTAGDPPDLVRADLLASANVIAAMLALPPMPRLVHLGSAAEYGPGVPGRPVSETDPAEPATPYGIVKLAATRLVVAAREQAGLEAVVLRVFNPLGSGMPESSLPGAALGRLREALARGGGPLRMGPLDAVRDFVDVRDVGRAVAAACLAPALEEPVLNVGRGEGRRAREVVVGLARRLGYGGGIEEDASAASPRSASVAWQVADLSRVRRVLAWEPAFDFEASCDLMVSGPTGSRPAR